jgi:hypothetical protein
MQADEQVTLDLQTARLTRRERAQAARASIGAIIDAAEGHPAIAAMELQGAAETGGIFTPAELEELAKIQDPQQWRRIAQGWQRATGKPEAGFTLSAGQTRYGPGGEIVAAAPVAAPAETFTLSPGQVRYGPGGQVLAQVAPTPPAPRDERLVQVIGPNGQPIWVRESQAVGRPAGTGAGAPGAPKLTAGQQEDIATMLTVEQLAKDVQTIDKEKGLPGVGPIEGRFLPSMRGSGGETGETLRNVLGNIQGTIAKLRGGASFTPSEQVLLDRYTPTTTDTDAAIRTKLKSLTDFIQKKRANTLRVAAGEYELPPAAPAVREAEGATYSVTAPNGKTYSFRSAQELAAFKKRAGIP